MDISRGTYDLSRRALLYDMPLFSFREYINLMKQKEVPVLPRDRFLDEYIATSKKYSVRYTKKLLENYFHYGQFGYRYANPDPYMYQERLRMMVKKTLYEDIPLLLAHISPHQIISSTRLEEILVFLVQTQE